MSYSIGEVRRTGALGKTMVRLGLVLLDWCASFSHREI